MEQSLSVTVPDKINPLGSVFRRGVVLNFNKSLCRDQALDFAKTLVDSGGQLFQAIKDKNQGWTVAPLKSEQQSERFMTNKVVVKFPDIRITIGEATIIAGMTCTVCRDDMHSKVWVRISFPKSFKKFKSLAKILCSHLKAFYIEKYGEFLKSDNALDYDCLYEIEIEGVDVSDPEFLDVVSEAQNTGDIIEAGELKKTTIIESLLKTFYKQVVGRKIPLEAPNDYTPSYLWNRWYDGEERYVSSPTIDGHKSIYFISRDLDKRKIIAKGLSMDSSYWNNNSNSEDPFQPSAHYTSAKLAGKIAAGL